MKSEYVALIKDIETDIYLMESLINDVEYYRELFERETDDPHAIAMNRENLEFAIRQYDEHTKYMHPILEEWLELTVQKEERPVNIGFFRILRYLREKKKMGI